MYFTADMGSEFSILGGNPSGTELQFVQELPWERSAFYAKLSFGNVFQCNVKLYRFGELRCKRLKKFAIY